MKRTRKRAGISDGRAGCFFSWVMLKCNGFAPFTTRFDALLRVAQSQKQAKFPKDYKAPGETPSHRGFSLDDQSAGLGFGRRSFLFRRCPQVTACHTLVVLLREYLMARWSAVESHLSVMTLSPGLPKGRGLPFGEVGFGESR